MLFLERQSHDNLAEKMTDILELRGYLLNKIVKTTIPASHLPRLTAKKDEVEVRYCAETSE